MNKITIGKENFESDNFLDLVLDYKYDARSYKCPLPPTFRRNKRD